MVKGMKQTEIGMIPEDWEVIRLGDYSTLKNGYAFSSIDFSDKGPIIMTPGNFKLGGGLKFNGDKLIRFKGHFSKNMQFKNGDLVMVMTDLTPDCNLLGKAGIIDTDEVVLHNQRIGKVECSKHIHSEYLCYYFNSEPFSARMKNTATGSTVRHTSTPTIKNTILPLPPLPEQEAIAGALSDADAWIDSLEQLIAKKRLIKQGAMQELLTPKEGWEVKKLGEIAKIIGGGTPSTFVSEYWNGEIEWFTPTEVGYEKYLYSSKRKISNSGLKNSSASILPVNTILLTSRAGIGDLGILKIEACTNQGFQSIICHSNVDFEFIYYLMLTKKEELLKNASGSTFLEISPNKVKSIEISLPSLTEQTRIATILSDMDAELEALEQQLHKARQIKQGMMQELLTGKIRLNYDAFDGL